MKNKIIIVSLVTASVVLMYFTFFQKGDKSPENQYESLKIIPIKIAHQYLYLKVAIWGVSADKEAVVVSRDSSQFVDINNDIIYEGLRNDYFFYIKQDTLNLILDMQPKKKNSSFDKLIKIDTVNNTKIYDLYSKQLMFDDSIKIVRF